MKSISELSKNIPPEVFTPNLILNQIRDSGIELQAPQPDMLIGELFAKAFKGFDEHLKQYLINNLAIRGYTFSNDAEFMEFVKTRITKLQFEDDPYWNELYVDYQSTENKGEIVGCYSTKPNFTYEVQDGVNVLMSISFGK